MKPSESPEVINLPLPKSDYYISNALNKLANSNLKLNQFSKAQQYNNQAGKIAQEVKNIFLTRNTAQTHYQIDSTLGDFKSAFHFYQIYNQAEDSISKSQKAGEFAKTETKFQIAKMLAEEEIIKQTAAQATAEEKERTNNLQYLAIAAIFILIFTGLFLLTKLKISLPVAKNLVFVSLLLFFEFAIILFDPLNDRYSGGIPIFKLAFNALLALFIAPLHSYIEKQLLKRFYQNTQNPPPSKEGEGEVATIEAISSPQPPENQPNS